MLKVLKLYRFALNAILLNVVSNFYIYTLTLTCFREFLRSGVGNVSASLASVCYRQVTTDRSERQRLLA